MATINSTELCFCVYKALYSIHQVLGEKAAPGLFSNKVTLEKLTCTLYYSLLYAISFH